MESGCKGEIDITGKRIKGHLVNGSVLDEETRCSHYHTERDRIAIKFYCCQTYFPCHLCHEEDGCDEMKVWPKSTFAEKAILCGACGEELTIQAYLESESHCPFCRAAFHPSCHLHENLYFDV